LCLSIWSEVWLLNFLRASSSCFYFTLWPSRHTSSTSGSSPILHFCGHSHDYVCDKLWPWSLSSSSQNTNRPFSTFCALLPALGPFSSPSSSLFFHQYKSCGDENMGRSLMNVMPLAPRIRAPGLPVFVPSWPLSKPLRFASLKNRWD
jgi:hypothetical protein